MFEQNRGQFGVAGYGWVWLGVERKVRLAGKCGSVWAGPTMW